MSEEESLARLRQTRAAFDSVAPDYDGPRGNNLLIQDMRAEMWRWLDRTFALPCRLLDLGCGTGLDAVRMARRGHQVIATDWSAEMVARTAARAHEESLADRVQALAIGVHELERLAESAAYDGAYSNLGPLNCAPDLGKVAHACARLLKPYGWLVFTVIGRLCPWEIVHYVRRGQWARARVRFASNAVPVSLNRHTVWTRYYWPREFYGPFEAEFELRHCRALCVLAPPPYLTAVRERHPRGYEGLWRLERRIAGWPGVRSMGDHFLIVMKKR